MRLEMIAPGGTIMGPQTYNSLFTLHGIIMIFLVVIPAIPTVLGNFFLPIQIGARDVAFPRINLLSWWLYISGAIIVFLSVFTGEGPPDTGWTFYAPYSLRTTVNVPLAVFGVFILGMSSILTGVNLVTTTHRLRAPGMTWFRLPLFVWGIYATAWVQILATPVIGITLVLIMLERYFGVGVFDPAKGGDPILYQHLFWIYSHPAVYIMILPAMGVISEVIPVFSRKSIFGYKAIAFSSIAIARLTLSAECLNASSDAPFLQKSNISSKSFWITLTAPSSIILPCGVSNAFSMVADFITEATIASLTSLSLIFGRYSSNINIKEKIFYQNRS
jgi:cytochrome c oxidase subunit 1